MNSRSYIHPRLTNRSGQPTEKCSSCHLCSQARTTAAVKRNYVGRTFIEPSQKIRSLGVKLKLNTNQTSIKNKKIILIDDSLVRGTTSFKIVKMLYSAGAKEVHVRIASPEIRYPDFYGVDTPTKNIR